MWFHQLHQLYQLHRPEFPVPLLPKTIDHPASPDHLFQPNEIGAGSAPDETVYTYAPRLSVLLFPFFTQRL